MIFAKGPVTGGKVRSHYKEVAHRKQVNPRETIVGRTTDQETEQAAAV